MAMKRCPVCGERYSDTYRYCPFCEEEDAIEDGEEIRRAPAVKSAGGRRSSRQPNLVTPTLIVLILVMAALLVYLLYGDKIAQRFQKDKDPDDGKPGVSDPVTPVKPTPGGTDPSGGSAGTMPDATEPGGTATPGGTDPTTTPGTTTPGTTTPETPTPSAELTYSTANALPGGLSLNKRDFTRSVSEGPYQLKVTSGGTAPYTWISEDPGIASVDSTGKVTPLAAGTVNILVTDGAKKGVCIVRVKGAAQTAAPQQPDPAPSSTGTYTLNNTDFTRSVSEGSYRLRVSGGTDAVSWSSSDPAVATVDGSGNVTPVAKGTARITATVNGQTLTCIVRVSG